MALLAGPLLPTPRLPFEEACERLGPPDQRLSRWSCRYSLVGCREEHPPNGFLVPVDASVTESESPILAFPPADHVEHSQRTDPGWEAGFITESDKPTVERLVIVS